MFLIGVESTWKKSSDGEEETMEEDSMESFSLNVAIAL